MSVPVRCEACGWRSDRAEPFGTCRECNGAMVHAPRSPRVKQTLEQRFWRYVDKGDGLGCWLWTGAALPKGYGMLGEMRGPAGSRKQAHTYTHRISWELHNGPIPEGLFVCHHCDNPPCVRPEHLFLGTARDNTRDMYKKGRGRKPPPPPNLVGAVFGKLRVVDGVNPRWTLTCECGRRFVRNARYRGELFNRPDCGCGAPEKPLRVLTLAGITRTEAEWARCLGVSRQALDQRLRAGWPLERALASPKTPGTQARRTA